MYHKIAFILKKILDFVLNTFAGVQIGVLSTRSASSGKSATPKQRVMRIVSLMQGFGVEWGGVVYLSVCRIMK